MRSKRLHELRKQKNELEEKINREAVVHKASRTVRTFLRSMKFASKVLGDTEQSIPIKNKAREGITIIEDLKKAIEEHRSAAEIFVLTDKLHKLMQDTPWEILGTRLPKSRNEDQKKDVHVVPTSPILPSYNNISKMLEIEQKATNDIREIMKKAVAAVETQDELVKLPDDNDIREPVREEDQENESAIPAKPLKQSTARCSFTFFYPGFNRDFSKLFKNALKNLSASLYRGLTNKK